MKPLDSEQGMRILDSVLSANNTHALLVPAIFDTAALRARAKTGVPSMLRSLVGTVRRTAGADVAPADMAARLASMDTAAARELLIDIIRTEAGTVLGSGGKLDRSRAFRDVGFDSLMAVELRNRLAAATGLRLPPGLVFDYPTPAVLAEHLHTKLFPDTDAVELPVLEEIDSIEAKLAVIGRDDELLRRATSRIEGLLSKLREIGKSSDTSVEEQILSATTDEEILEFVEKNLGL